MATTVSMSIGSRPAESVTINSVTASTAAGHADAWDVTLVSTPSSATKVGDKLTEAAKDYLITKISGTVVTVVGDPFLTTTAPVNGAALIGRSFPSISGWAAKAPADLTKSNSNLGWVWKGDLYKEGSGADGEWSVTSTITFNSIGNVTSFFLLEAAESFASSTNKLSNQLRYAPKNGASVHITGNYAWAFNVHANTILHVSGVQINLSYRPINTGDGTLNLNNCIIKSAGVYAAMGDNASAVNSVIYSAGTSLPISGANQGTIHFINCSLFGKSPTAFKFGNYVRATIQNCAIFGFTASVVDHPAKVQSVSTHNATDLATFGWANGGTLVSKLASNQFESVTSGSEDFRTKATADLAGAATPNSIYTNNLDIVKTARSLTAPTIGAWEIGGASSGPSERQSFFDGIARGIARGIA